MNYNTVDSALHYLFVLFHLTHPGFGFFHLTHLGHLKNAKWATFCFCTARVRIQNCTFYLTKWATHFCWCWGKLMAVFDPTHSTMNHIQKESVLLACNKLTTVYCSAHLIFHRQEKHPKTLNCSPYFGRQFFPPSCSSVSASMHLQFMNEAYVNSPIFVLCLPI